jgi:hypothetical protein
MAYIGNAPAQPNQGPASVTTQTATSSQTTFTVSGGYSVGFIDVYQNGVRLVPSTDYTANNGTTVVLVTGATLNDELMFVAYQTNLIGGVSVATSALNLSGGSAGQIPYQTGNGVTAFSSINLTWGSGVPSSSQPKGSLYIRLDGSSSSDRMYINTNGSTGWTNLTTAA